MARKKTYMARFELDEDGYWFVVAELGGGRSALSDGQTLPKARRRIRQSIALLLDVDERSFEVLEEVNLPNKAMERLRRYRGARKKLEQDAVEAAEAARAAAKVLAALGVSRRDTGDLLGLSGARVQQVLDES